MVCLWYAYGEFSSEKSKQNKCWVWFNKWKANFQYRLGNRPLIRQQKRFKWDFEGIAMVEGDYIQRLFKKMLDRIETIWMVNLKFVEETNAYINLQN